MAFKALEGDLCVIRIKGVYRQCGLYTFNGGLFAKDGGGFIRLKVDGSTSKPDAALEHIEIEGPLFKDRFGRLCVVAGEGHKPVSVSAEVDTLRIESKGDG